MKLITVEAAFPEAEVAKAISAFEGQAGAVRTMDGCEAYAIYRALEGGTVAIVQRWRTMEAFDAYRGSDTFATLGQTLKPMMAAPPVTTIADIAT